MENKFSKIFQTKSEFFNFEILETDSKTTLISIITKHYILLYKDSQNSKNSKLLKKIKLKNKKIPNYKENLFTQKFIILNNKIYILTGGEIGYLYLINIFSNKINLLKGHNGSLINIEKFKLNENLILTSSKDFSIILWDLESKNILFRFINKKSYNCNINCLSVNFNDEFFVIGKDDKSIEFFDLDKKEVVLIKENILPSNITFVQFYGNIVFCLSICGNLNLIHFFPKENKVEFLRYIDLSYNTFTFFSEILLDERGFVFLPLEDSRIGIMKLDKYDEVLNLKFQDKGLDKIVKIRKNKENSCLYVKDRNCLTKLYINIEIIYRKLESIE